MSGILRAFLHLLDSSQISVNRNLPKRRPLKKTEAKKAISGTVSFEATEDKHKKVEPPKTKPVVSKTKTEVKRDKPPVKSSGIRLAEEAIDVPNLTQILAQQPFRKKSVEAVWKRLIRLLGSQNGQLFTVTSQPRYFVPLLQTEPGAPQLLPPKHAGIRGEEIPSVPSELDLKIPAENQPCIVIPVNARRNYQPANNSTDMQVWFGDEGPSATPARLPLNPIKNVLHAELLKSLHPSANAQTSSDGTFMVSASVKQEWLRLPPILTLIMNRGEGGERIFFSYPLSLNVPGGDDGEGEEDEQQHLYILQAIMVRTQKGSFDVIHRHQSKWLNWDPTVKDQDMTSVSPNERRRSAMAFWYVRETEIEGGGETDYTRLAKQSAFVLAGALSSIKPAEIHPKSKQSHKQPGAPIINKQPFHRKQDQDLPLSARHGVVPLPYAPSFYRQSSPGRRHRHRPSSPPMSNRRPLSPRRSSPSSRKGQRRSGSSGSGSGSDGSGHKRPHHRSPKSPVGGYVSP